jgi:hypothetical protein
MRVLKGIARLLAAYDRWCTARVEAWLRWIEAWFSISQLETERALLVLYLIAAVVGPQWELRMPGSILIVATLYWLHRRPTAKRQVFRHYQPIGFHVVRALLQASWIFLALNDLRVQRPTGALSDIYYLILFYAVYIPLDEDRRGRRRKLALAELKKLFGTEWIAKPAPMPQS